MGMTKIGNPRGLGTFAGVFTPSILTILGIILFLRMGYVIGNAGLALALVIIALANIISILTAFSLSAIATNLKVKPGGDYYLISRTLGVEFGGAIGIVLFLSQSVSIAFYCIGFGEVVATLLPLSFPFMSQIIAACAVFFIFFLAWLGSDLATRFQYIVMFVLIMALCSFYIGGLSQWDNGLLERNWTPYSSEHSDFWVLFAIFFPAVTGFTQGVSMSGELKDPSKSLPLGTFLAVGISICIYFSVALVFAASTTGELMATNYGSMQHTARWSFLIDAGIIAATLSSAMASFLGAPRILQSLASDQIFPLLNFFAAGSGVSNNPRRGVLMSFVIALMTVALGRLDLVAQIVSMFFLISYGLLNYATYYEARSSSPSFRPRFKWYDKKLSLAGFLACLGIMVAIDFKTALIAITILFGVYQYIKRTAGPARWADGQRSYHLERARVHLSAAAAEIEHPRDWRPYIIALSNDPLNRKELLKIASWLEGGSGLTTVTEVLAADGAKSLKDKALAEKALQQDISRNESGAFPLVVSADDTYSGFQALVQSWGIGPIQANTFLLNCRETERIDHTGKDVLVHDRQMKAAYAYGCNLAIFSGSPLLSESSPASDDKVFIDVWWKGDKTGRLSLLFAYLLTRNEQWENAVIRLQAMNYRTDSEKNRENLRLALEESRIGAQSEIIVDADEGSIVQLSGKAAFVFLPFRLTKDGPVSIFSTSLNDLLSHLPTSVAVLAAEDIELDAEPEEGKVGEIASAIDNVSKAKDRLEKAEKKESEVLDAIEQDARKNADSPKTEVKEAPSQAKEPHQPPEKEAEKAHRRVSKERAKLKNALQEAEDLGIENDN